jgi:hypothetical protein
MRKLQFYTKEQVAEINVEINKGTKPSVIVKQLAKKFKREPKHLMQKIYLMRRELGLITKKANSAKIEVIETPKQENTLAQEAKGMVITLYPKSVTIEGNVCKMNF